MKKAVKLGVPPPPPTFDTLLSTDTYKVYSEARAVGSLIHSPAIQDILEPVMSLARPPKEFKTIVQWLGAHGEALAGSRMMAASWPSRPDIPNILLAVEFSNADEALKFERQLRGFVPTLLPSPTPGPVGSPGPGMPNVSGSGTAETQSEASLPPYHIKQSGSLVLISDRPVNFNNLRSRGSKLLEEDANFTLARNRFASESLFVYVDFKSIEKEEKARRQKWEEEEQRRLEEQGGNRGNRAATVAPPDDTQVNPELPPPEVIHSESITIQRTNQGELQPTLSNAPPDGGTTRIAADPTAADTLTTKDTEEMARAFPSLYSLFFGGESKWPEGVAAGISFEGDAYVLRVLIVNSAENKSNPLPFIAQFVSGPAMVSQAPNIFPADTSLFLNASVDYPQIYEGVVKAIASAEEAARKYRKQPAGYPDAAPPASPFAIYEKKLGIKIKEDLLPLLGNELALGMLSVAKPENNSSSAKSGIEDGPKKTRAAEPNPVIAIAVKDKEAVRRLIPKLIESLGFKGANLFAQTEKREETEITSYANV
ncbi:MAG: hypothetical protein ABR501_09520, partial [Pyrinomonadaceae bacterium]